MKSIGRQHRLAALLACIFTLPATADDNVDSADPAKSTPENVFTLGQITVTGKQPDASSVGTATLDREDIWDFNRDGVLDALNLIPGVAATTGSGNRNEAVISVRGFDRLQVPLLMDGIRLYLPADNRVDFDRLLTPDLSEIQVSKGYVSVLNGPDGMGGAINLVTRKPVKPFESEVRVSGAFASNGQYNGNTLYANLGTRQPQYYLQASAEQRDIRHWRLSNDFQPTPAEDGGNRDHTDKKDWRVNLKAGFTPNATDEYSLNYVNQKGRKHGIGAVTGTSAISAWDWPEWDTSSVYWLSNTKIDEKSYIKTKAYYNTFTNTLVAYTNPTLTLQNFTSYYDDNAKGFSVEVGTDHLPQQTLKGSFHYRRDEHVEWQYLRAATKTTPADFTEPKQKVVEDMYSLAIEDTWHVTPAFDLVAGLSRDARHSKQAQDFGSIDGNSSSVLFDYPVANSYATNYQGAAIYNYSKSGKVHFFASDRTRFPTIFERYSSRFGGAVSNPGLRPERALNLEVGIADRLSPRLSGEVALFHSRVKDAIQPVSVVYMGANYSQNQNVGTATFKGVELSFAATPFDSLDIGGNYTYIDTKVDNPDDPSVRLTTTPRNKAFLYAKWLPVPEFKIIPNIEYADSRWSSRASGTGYVETGAYTLVNLKVEYKIHRDWDVSFAAQNLLDKNYEVADGYPQEGRNFTLTVRFQM